MASQNSALPVTEKPGRGGPSLHPGFYIGSWMFFSNMTIIFNKWLVDSDFKYPVILTCWHLVFATFATQVLSRTTTLVDGRKKVKMTGRIYLRAILPIGVLYSGSLVCSNQVYLYLNVAFIQMLKAAAPVAVLFISWLWGVANPTRSNVINVLVITAGVGLASFGEVQFSWVGFLFQVGGIVFEAMRLVMIQLLLSGEDMKMDPMVSLYYFAPVCAVMNIIVALFTEAYTFEYAHLASTGFLILLMNALVAFMLNVASVFLIGKTSSLVLTLAGILKAILLVITSVIIWSNTITFLQFFGYSVALAGLVYYSVGWQQIQKGYIAANAWTQQVLSSGDEGRLPPLVRRFLVLGVVALTTLIIFVSYWRDDSAPTPVESPDTDGGIFSWFYKWSN